MNGFKTTLLATALIAALPLVAQAESEFDVTGGSAEAKLDFRVTIPRILFLRVGSSGTAIDLIDFSPAAATLGNGAFVTAGTGGDLGGGAVTAQVRGNNGDVTLTSSTVGALTNDTGDTISYSQISATTSNALLQSPTLLDGATGTTTVAATGKIVNQNAQWTFSYANSAVVAPGTYGGSVAKNGRVTYTASMP